MAVPEPYAGQRLDLDVAQRGPLGFREALELALGEADVGARGGRDLGHAAVDLALAQAEFVGGPAVGAPGVVAHRLVAPAPDGVDDVGDGLGDLAPSIVIGIGRV